MIAITLHNGRALGSGAAVQLAAIVLSLSCLGCSAYMAANQPGPKDLSLLNKGTPRAKLIAEYGAPIHTETKDGTRRDIFKFKHGYHGGVKAGRAVAHGAATVATLGLWEIVGTPTEGYLNGTELSAEVHYDGGDAVAIVKPLTGEDEIARAIGPAGGVPSQSSVRTGTPTETSSTR